MHQGERAPAPVNQDGFIRAREPQHPANHDASCTRARGPQRQSAMMVALGRKSPSASQPWRRLHQGEREPQHPAIHDGCIRAREPPPPACKLLTKSYISDDQSINHGDSSVVRAPDSWLKGRGFESLLERRENFLLQGRLSVLTLISVSVPPPCYHSST